MSNEYRYGFRVFGALSNPRALVAWDRAFVDACACRVAARPGEESYLSAFCFGPDFRQYLRETGSVRGYDGATWARYVWFDVDRTSIRRARLDAARLVDVVAARYCAPEDDLLLFFSGCKGFHVGVPTALCGAEPSPDFHRDARRFAERIAELARVNIDTAIYDRARAFRAPNSRHPKTGLYKRRLTFAELCGLSPSEIQTAAQRPLPFLPPGLPGEIQAAAEADWLEAAAQQQQRKRATASFCPAADAPTPNGRVNALTTDFIRHGAPEGERALRLFAAAANLAEAGTPPDVITALLHPAARDSGLAPSEIRRQIECGIQHAQKGGDQ